MVYDVSMSDTGTAASPNITITGTRWIKDGANGLYDIVYHGYNSLNNRTDMVVTPRTGTSDVAPSGNFVFNKDDSLYYSNEYTITNAVKIALPSSVEYVLTSPATLGAVNNVGTTVIHYPYDTPTAHNSNMFFKYEVSVQANGTLSLIHI